MSPSALSPLSVGVDVHKFVQLTTDPPSPRSGLDSTDDHRVCESTRYPNELIGDVVVSRFRGVSVKKRRIDEE